MIQEDIDEIKDFSVEHISSSGSSLSSSDDD